MRIEVEMKKSINAFLILHFKKFHRLNDIPNASRAFGTFIFVSDFLFIVFGKL